MLSKDKKSQKGLKEKVQAAVKSALEYYKDKPENPFQSRKDSILFVVDIIQGLICLTKGDLLGMRPLALKLGGFPESIEKLEQFYKTIK